MTQRNVTRCSLENKVGAGHVSDGVFAEHSFRASDRFRRQRAGFLQHMSHSGWGRRVSDSLDKWNGKIGNSVSAIVQDGKRNVDYALHFVAFAFLISVLLDPCQVRPGITRRVCVVLFTPELYGSRTDFGSLMRQDYVPRRCTHETDNRPAFT
jgi:hypothetical protein